MRWKVTYKGYAHKTWIEMYKIVTANSKEDAIKKSRPLGRYNFKSRIDMNQELKLLAAIGIMPVLADFLEDLNEDKAFRTDMKIATQNLIAQIRKMDERVMKNASAETSEQQINIQIAFRQWLKTAKDTDEN